MDKTQFNRSWLEDREYEHRLVIKMVLVGIIAACAGIYVLVSQVMEPVRSMFNTLP